MMTLTEEQIKGIINNVKHIMISHSMISLDYIPENHYQAYKETIAEFIQHNLELMQISLKEEK